MRTRRLCVIYRCGNNRVLPLAAAPCRPKYSPTHHPLFFVTIRKYINDTHAVRPHLHTQLLPKRVAFSRWYCACGGT